MAKKATYITRKEGLHPVEKKPREKAKKTSEYYRGVAAGPKKWAGRRTNLQTSPVAGTRGDAVAARKETAKELGLERIGETIKKKKKK